MSKKKNNADAVALAEGYGVSLNQAKTALEEDAPRPTAMAEEKPADQVLPKSTVAPADSGPRATSTQLAVFYCLSRDQMESELVRLGLRGPADDGSSLYPIVEVSRRLAEEDSSRITAAAELLVNFTADPGLAAKIVEGVIGEEIQRWISENSLHAEIVDLKKRLLSRFKKTHSYQMAKGSGDCWRELAAIQKFGSALLDATAERRQKTQTQGDVYV